MRRYDAESYCKNVEFFLVPVPVQCFFKRLRWTLHSIDQIHSKLKVYSIFKIVLSTSKLTRKKSGMAEQQQQCQQLVAALGSCMSPNTEERKHAEGYLEHVC